MTSPLESGIINAKIANGEVKPDRRFPGKPKKPSIAEAPLHKPPLEIEPAKEASKEKKEPKGLPKEKKTAKKQPKEVKFPIETFINGYGFLGISKSLLRSWGWKPGKGQRTLVTLDLVVGTLVVKKKVA